MEARFDELAFKLGSFAGSGTAAHAALALNREDGGNRQCVGMEGYADEVRAEWVRRVIKGVPNTEDENPHKGRFVEFLTPSTKLPETKA